MATEFLTNQLLIAMPAMTDPNFSQTVTLICEHSAKGALGLVLNRPLPMKLSDVFEQLSLDAADARLEHVADAELRYHGLDALLWVQGVRRRDWFRG